MDLVIRWEKLLKQVSDHTQLNKIIHSMFGGIGMYHYNAPMNAPTQVEDRDRTLPKSDILLLMPSGYWIIVRTFLQKEQSLINGLAALEMQNAITYFQNYLGKPVGGFCFISHEEDIKFDFSLSEISTSIPGTVLSTKTLLRFSMAAHDHAWSYNEVNNYFESLLDFDINLKPEAIDISKLSQAPLH